VAQVAKAGGRGRREAHGPERHAGVASQAGKEGARVNSIVGSGRWARPKEFDFFFFFLNIFSVHKPIQKIPDNVFKARKFGTRGIQIKYLGLMKKILEPSKQIWT
jgi:hypothetical protein